nr:RNA polymerase-binding protein RbpA [uncultured Actinomyces sp.]
MIRFNHVSKVYDRGMRPALDDVDIKINRDEFVFLVGASGSGKSTFLRLVIREERPTKGRIHVLGRDLSKISSWKVPQLRQEIGFVCPSDHHFTVMFSEEAELPTEWECQRCGKIAARADGTQPEEKEVKPPRTHYDMLRERRSIPELEELMAERLALLREES